MAKTVNALATDVFTPTTPARLTFVERKSINDKLVDALRTPGKQVVVYGHSGSGKTTLLLNKLEQLYENHITTRCTTSMSFESILLNAFDQLSPFVTTERTSKATTALSAGLSADYLAIKSQLGATKTNERQSKDTRALPPQLTPQALAGFLGESHCCWVLEDFHKVSPEHKTALAQIMKLFMDMADQYKELKIVAIGAVDTARQVIEYDAEMRNRVSEILVPLMSEDEIRAIIDKGEQLLNFKMSDSVKSGIVTYSNGLAAVCHQLCLNICYVGNISESLKQAALISDDELTEALKMYIDNCSDTLKGAFDSALRQRKRKYENGRLIIEALCDFDESGATHADILGRIRRKHADYPASNLTLYLDELQTVEKGAIVRKDAASSRFSFSDPFHRVYAQAMFRPEVRVHTPGGPSRESVEAVVRALLEKAIQQALTKQQYLP